MNTRLTLVAASGALLLAVAGGAPTARAQSLQIPPATSARVEAPAGATPPGNAVAPGAVPDANSVSAIAAALQSAAPAVANAMTVADPTRPPAALLPGAATPPAAAAQAAAQPASPAWVLQSVMFGERRRLAILNGQEVREGTMIGATRVVSIQRDAVLLQTGAGRLRVPLYPAVKRRGISQRPVH